MTALETSGTPVTPVSVPWPCGFWRRVAASCVDALLLGIVGYLLGRLWGGWFSELGQSGRWIGSVIAGVYFISFHAYTGQSPGKKALGLKVVRLDGTPIDAKQATVRYLAYGVPWVLNGMFFAGVGVPVFLLVVAGVVLGVVVFGGLFGNIYLLIFNVPSRRLVHDVLAGTVVVRELSLPCVPEAARVAFKRLHLAIVAGLVAAMFGVLVWIGWSLEGGIKGLAPLMEIQRQVAAMPGVRTAQVNEAHSVSKGVRKHALMVVIVLSPGAHSERRAIALSAVSRALAFWSHEAKDFVTVQVNEGYDIGIWKQWRSEGESHSADEWVETLKRNGVEIGADRA